MWRPSVGLAAGLCLSFTGCVQIASTCQCTGGSSATFSGSECGSINDAAALLQDAFIRPQTDCVLSGGIPGACTFDVVVVQQCPIETSARAIKPTPDLASIAP